MSQKLSLAAILLVSGVVFSGCSGGGGDEANYTGETAKFENADKPGAAPAAKKGAAGLQAEP